MKGPLSLALAVLALFSTGVLPTAAQTRPWSGETAYPLPAGRLEAGLLQRVRYGLTDAVELSTTASAPVRPGLRAKVAWGRRGGWLLATQHDLYDPTPLLRLVSREGVGGLLPSDARVPHLLAFTNQALLTRPLGGRHWLTAEAGVRLALRLGQADFPTLDLPLLYPRTAAYHGGAVVQGGLALDGYLSPRWAYGLRADVFALTRETHVTIEQQGRIAYAAGRVQPFAGYTWVRGEYPFGTQRHLLPHAGFRWVR